MDLVLFGIQGSGKGTQAKKLAAQRGYKIFEAGGELRKIAASGTELGQKVSAYIDHGHLVPFAIIMEVVRTFVESGEENASILFDGIPRDPDQMHAFDDLMAKAGRTFTGVHIGVNEEEALKRIVQRAKEQGRADDASEEFIRRRMTLFHEKTEPVIESYKQRGKLIEIDGAGSVDEVYGRIETALRMVQ